MQNMLCASASWNVMLHCFFQLLAAGKLMMHLKRKNKSWQPANDYSFSDSSLHLLKVLSSLKEQFEPQSIKQKVKQHSIIFPSSMNQLMKYCDKPQKIIIEYNNNKYMSQHITTALLLSKKHLFTETLFCCFCTITYFCKDYLITASLKKKKKSQQSLQIWAYLCVFVTVLYLSHFVSFKGNNSILVLYIRQCRWGGALWVQAPAFFQIIKKCQTNSNNIVGNKTKCIWIIINMTMWTK